MLDFDFVRLKSILVSASRNAFKDLRNKHNAESIYCMGFFTSSQFISLLPVALTEDGLGLVSQNYLANPDFANESDAKLRLTLRWSPTDSPFLGEGAEYFTNVNVLMLEFSEALRSIDIDSGWSEFNAFINRIEESICEVLMVLDGEFIFGVGHDREKVFVSLLMGEWDNSIYRVGRRLNPPETFGRFAKEFMGIEDNASIWCSSCGNSLGKFSIGDFSARICCSECSFVGEVSTMPLDRAALDAIVYDVWVEWSGQDRLQTIAAVGNALDLGVKIARNLIDESLPIARSIQAKEVQRLSQVLRNLGLSIRTDPIFRWSLEP